MSSITSIIYPFLSILKAIMTGEKVVPKEITIVSKGALVAQVSRSVMSRTDKILVFSGQV